MKRKRFSDLNLLFKDLNFRINYQNDKNCFENEK